MKKNAAIRDEIKQNCPKPEKLQYPLPKIKFCGLTRTEDIEMVNALKIDYAGFVFAKKSRRHVSVEQAELLRRRLSPDIQAVGVFVNEDIRHAAELLKRGVIDIAQLHGDEDEAYIKRLKEWTGQPVIKAFRMESGEDCRRAEASSADFVLLDSGNGGTGKCFDWNLLHQVKRQYFLAGGLDARNVRQAVFKFHPYALDVSSGIETDGKKDRAKMQEFVSLLFTADSSPR